MARPRKTIIQDTIELPVSTTDPLLIDGQGGYPSPSSGVSASGEPGITTIQVSASGNAALDDVSAVNGYLGGRLTTLPRYIDEIDRDYGWAGPFGKSIYDDMCNEASVSASVGLLMTSAMGQTPSFKPPKLADEPSEADYAVGQKIVSFIRRNMADMDAPIMSVVQEIIEGAFTHGHKLGRKRYESAHSDDVGGQALWLREIRPKPNNATMFVVDSLNRWLGCIHVSPALGFISPSLQPNEAGIVEGLEPRSLFAHASYKPKNLDPRGTSGLRPAYHPYRTLQKIYRSKDRYIGLYGTPILHTTLPPDARDELYDRSTNPPTPLATPIKATKVQNDEFKKVQAGGVVTTQHDSTATLLQPKGEGAFYESAQASEMMRVAFAILYQELATMEGRHQARAASQVHRDALDVRIRQIKTWAEDFIYWEIVIPLVDINFGRKYRYLAPVVSLGQVELKDFAAIGSVFAQLLAARGIPLDILNDILESLGLPQSAALDELLDNDPQAALSSILNQGPTTLHNPSAPFGDAGNTGSGTAPPVAADAAAA